MTSTHTLCEIIVQLIGYESFSHKQLHVKCDDLHYSDDERDADS